MIQKIPDFRGLLGFYSFEIGGNFKKFYVLFKNNYIVNVVTQSTLNNPII